MVLEWAELGDAMVFAYRTFFGCITGLWKLDATKSGDGEKEDSRKENDDGDGNHANMWQVGF